LRNSSNNNNNYYYYDYYYSLLDTARDLGVIVDSLTMSAHVSAVYMYLVGYTYGSSDLSHECYRPWTSVLTR